MKILVIGGGMSGLTFGTVACKIGHDVTLAERNSRVGKKLALTGNGRCNLANENVAPDRYNDSELVRRIIGSVSVEEYKRFLSSCGIFTYADGDGRVYPITDSAASVVDCLRFGYAKSGGKLLVDTAVTSVERAGDGYRVTLGGKTEFFDKVALCCGSGSQAVKPDLTCLLPTEWFTPLVPSLVPVKVSDADKTLNGLRVKANVTLFCDGKAIAEERGEVLFREYGLSGICIFNLSAVIARRTVAGKAGKYVFVIDALPQFEEQTLAQILAERLSRGDEKVFLGILHGKLGDYAVKRAGAHADGAQLAHTAKHLVFSFDKLLDWSMSQVTAGGIDEKFVDPATLALPNGVIALGEVLNADGVCGGYNLYFAAASALYAFTAEERNKAF